MWTRDCTQALLRQGLKSKFLEIFSSLFVSRFLQSCSNQNISKQFDFSPLGKHCNVTKLHFFRFQSSVLFGWHRMQRLLEKRTQRMDKTRPDLLQTYRLMSYKSFNTLLVALKKRKIIEGIPISHTDSNYVKKVTFQSDLSLILMYIFNGFW